MGRRRGESGPGPAATGCCSLAGCRSPRGTTTTPPPPLPYLLSGVVIDKDALSPRCLGKKRDRIRLVPPPPPRGGQRAPRGFGPPIPPPRGTTAGGGGGVATYRAQRPACLAPSPVRVACTHPALREPCASLPWTGRNVPVLPSPHPRPGRYSGLCSPASSPHPRRTFLGGPGSPRLQPERCPPLILVRIVPHCSAPAAPPPPSAPF